MKQIAFVIALCLSAALPAHAQQDPAPAPIDPAPPAPPEPADDLEQGSELMKEAGRLLLRGLMNEMEPALKDMEQALSEMEPALGELMAMIGDLRNYEAPVKLPNGDILIRRKPSADPEAAPEDEPGAEGEGQIDL